jgi:hypothetical protein
MKSDRTRGGKSRESIDASPGNASLDAPARPKNIRETKAWQDGSAGVKKMWWNYKQTLSESFKRMGRAQQEQLITQLSMIVTIGTTILLLSFFYNFLPQVVRVFALPLIGVGSWWAGTRIVAPIMIGRYDEYLNREF